jgi:hypothetical protein
MKLNNDENKIGYHVSPNGKLVPFLTQRFNFTFQHIEAALLCCEKSYIIEQDNHGKPFGPFFTDLRSYVSLAIISSVAAIEANINEHFCDIFDGFLEIPEIKIDDAKEIWKDIERNCVWDKYETLLKISKKKLDKNKIWWQHTKILVKVRNELVHFKPIWRKQNYTEKNIENEINKLKNTISFSEFIESSQLLFPMRCMTYEFANWAVDTAVNFIINFDVAIGIKSRLEKFKDRVY